MSGPSKRRQSLLAVQAEVATGRRRGVAGGGSLEDARKQLVNEQRRRRAIARPKKPAPVAPPQRAAERCAREKLARMENIRRRYADDSRVSEADVERQRAVVANLASKGGHDCGAEMIVWLVEPVGVPGSKLVVFGWDRVMGPPTWLAELIDRGEFASRDAN